MKKGPAAILTISCLLVAAHASAQMGMGRGMGPGMMGYGPSGASMLRHRYAMMNGIGAKYAKARNPLVANSENLRAGEALFETNCASCHGASGRGDGPAATGLNPPPSDLSAAVKIPMASDPYLVWTISEGGVPLQSAMPPFKTTLSKNQIWQLVLYLRTL